MIPAKLVASSQSSSSLSAKDRNLPAFVLPVNLYVYADDTRTHRQIVTIYNPYDFAVNYKVLSTAPETFTISEPEGSISPRHSLDLVLRHLQPEKPENFRRATRFKVDFFETWPGETRRMGQHIGTGHFSCFLQSSRSTAASGSQFLHAGDSSLFSSTAEDADFRAALHGGETSSSSSMHRGPGSTASAGGSARAAFFAGTSTMLNQYTAPFAHRPSYMYIFFTTICIIILSLPDQNQDTNKSSVANDYVPKWLRTTENYRLVAAYALGLLTMVILRM